MKKKHLQPLTSAALYARVSSDGVQRPAGRGLVRVRPVQCAQGLRQSQFLGEPEPCTDVEE